MKRTWLKWILVVAYVALVAAVAAHRYGTAGVPSDFDVFWRAGHRFLHSQPLYPSEPIDTSFLYPPFAAFVFQLLALFPLRLAAAGAWLVLTLLFPVAVWLTWDIVTALLPTASRRVLPFILATAVSFRFFQADAGWIGEAGPGPSYLDPGSGGPENDFTNRNTTFMTWNLMHMARMIRDAGGIPAHGNQRSEWDAGCRFDFDNPDYR